MNVSKHAIKRFRERTNCNRYDQSIIDKLIYMVQHGEEVKPKKHYGVMAILNHNFKEARYYDYFGQYVLVVEEDTIVTVHKGEARRWERI